MTSETILSPIHGWQWVQSIHVCIGSMPTLLNRPSQQRGGGEHGNVNMEHGQMCMLSHIVWNIFRYMLVIGSWQFVQLSDIYYR